MAKKILVVDDEKDVLDMLEARLTNAGFSVVKASDGNEGLEKAGAEKPDLIILDVLLPGLSGGDVAKKLCEDPETQNIPIIFLTATLTKDQEIACRSLGSSYFLAKPYDGIELLEIIYKLIGYPE